MMKAKLSIVRAFAAPILLFLLTPTIPGFAQGTWSTKAPMPVGLQPGVGVVNGILYAVAGFTPTGFGPNTNEAYNPTTDAWTVLAPPPGTPVGADGGNNVAVLAGIVYMIGGNAQGFCTNANVAYNPVTNVWAVKAPMPTPRCGAAVVADNGRIYAIGGINTSSTIFYSTVEVYDPGSDSWAGAAPMPTARQGPGAAVSNGIIYVAGGRTPTNISTLEAYNPSTNTWTTGLAPMPKARFSPATGVIGNVMYVVGGLTDIGIVRTNEGYDPSTNTWSEFAPMPTARFLANAGVIGGTMYVLGGASSTSGAITTNEAFSPTGITNQPPVANAGPDQTVECTSHTGTPVTLDGSKSSDPDGDPLTFKWTDKNGNVIGTTAVINRTLPLGAFTFNLTVTDPGGLSSSTTTHVTVRDTTPPMLSVSLSPNVLWPPNRKLAPITASIQVSDICDPNPRVTLVSITSNEPLAPSDVQGAVIGTDTRSFFLRAERLGTGTGRVYAVRYRAMDASGNMTFATAQVMIPHDQGKRARAAKVR